MIRIALGKYGTKDVAATVLTFEEDEAVFWHQGEEVVRHPRRDVTAVEFLTPSEDDLISRVRVEHPNAWKPWTDELDDELLACAAKDFSVDQMAKHFGRKPNAIRARLKALAADE